MEIRSLFICLLANLVSSQDLNGFERCVCVKNSACQSERYGSNALDISILGLYSPCPNLGEVRCCSRDGLEYLYDNLHQISHEASARFKVKPVQVRNESGRTRIVPQDVKNPTGTPYKGNFEQFSELLSRGECGCVPRGRCELSHVVAAQIEDDNRQKFQLCGSVGVYELCCSNPYIFPRVTDKESSYDWEAGDDLFKPDVDGVTIQPVFKAQAFDFKRNSKYSNVDDDRLGNPDKVAILPCVPLSDCQELYGEDPQHIATWGVLPPCRGEGLHRCASLRDKDLNEKIMARMQPDEINLAMSNEEISYAADDLFNSESFGVESKKLLPSAIGSLPSVRLVPCVLKSRCFGIPYSTADPNHLEIFGILPKCQQGLIRCIFDIDLGILSRDGNLQLPVFTNAHQSLSELKSKNSLPVVSGPSPHSRFHSGSDIFASLASHPSRSQSSEDQPTAPMDASLRQDELNAPMLGQIAGNIDLMDMKFMENESYFSNGFYPSTDVEGEDSSDVQGHHTQDLTHDAFNYQFKEANEESRPIRFHDASKKPFDISGFNAPGKPGLSMHNNVNNQGGLYVGKSDSMITQFIQEALTTSINIDRSVGRIEELSVDQIESRLMDLIDLLMQITDNQDAMNFFRAKTNKLTGQIVEDGIQDEIIFQMTKPSVKVDTIKLETFLPLFISITSSIKELERRGNMSQYFNRQYYQPYRMVMGEIHKQL